MFWDMTTRRKWTGYVVAVLAVAVATVFRIELLHILGTRSPFLTFYGVVMLSAAYGGLYPGLLATTLSAVLVILFWMEPFGSFAISDPADVLVVVILAVSGIMISFICEALLRSQIRLRDLIVESKVRSRELQNTNTRLEAEATKRQAVQEAMKGLNTRLEAEGAERQATQEALQDLNTRLEEEGSERQAAQEALQDLNTRLEEEATKRQTAQEVMKDLNTRLKEEATKRQETQGAMQDLNMALEEEVTERHAAQEALQELNTALEEEVTERQAAQEALQDLNTRLEEEATKRQAAQQAMKGLNTRLEAEGAERQAAQEALQDLNTALEEEVTERQATQEALQDLNTRLEEEATKRQAAQEAMKGLNTRLEEEVKERQAAQEALQDLNTALEEEATERQAAQVASKNLNTRLEEEVTERQAAQEALQDLNTALEEEAIERQAAQEALKDLNTRLKEEATKRQVAQEALLAVMDERLIREQQLKQYANQVAATNIELQSFVNILAHDFRSPMVNLKGFSQELGYTLAELRQVIYDETLHLPEKTSAKIDELLDKDVPSSQQFINSAVDRMSMMVDTLLNLARLGRREMNYKQVDMGNLVNTVLQSYHHQTEEKNILVEVGALPIIETDQQAVEQIMSNLVDNAIKYMMPSRSGTICISYQDNGGEYLFSVQDNGCGIAIGDQEKVFEIFRRAGNQDMPGEGMGLAYVRALLIQLGGRVWCESELGTGTTMKFTVAKVSPIK